MKTLNDYTPDQRRKAARACSTNPLYLYQCGVGLRTPSLSLAEKLMKRDHELTVAGLLLPKRKRDARLKRQAKRHPRGRSPNHRAG